MLDHLGVTAMPAARRKRIAFLSNDLSNAYQASFRAAVERAARQNDLSLVVAIGREVGHPDPHERAQNVVYTDWLGPASVDGVIILAAATSNFCGKEGLEALCERFAPLPACSIGLALENAPSILVNNRDGMRASIDHLLRVHGCRRIGYIGGPRDNDEAAERLAGYRDALASAGVAFDPDLVTIGDFGADSGQYAMTELLQRGASIDAVAAANDYMALGAMDVIREANLGLAERILVMGFDDTPAARFAARSLSTIQQPADQMSDLAVQHLRSAMNGEQPPARTFVPVNLVLRESCGCGYVVRSGSILPQAPDTTGRASQFLKLERERLFDALQPKSGSSKQLWPRWAAELLDSLQRELEGEAGTFLRVVDRLAEDAAKQAIPLDEIGAAITFLRAQFHDAGYRVDARVDLERLWMKAMAIQSAATTRLEGRIALNLTARATGLRHASQRLSVALDSASLASALERSLHELGVSTCLVSLRKPDAPAQMEPIFAARNGVRLSITTASYPVAELLPNELRDDSERFALVMFALTFENDVLGKILLDTEADPFVCEALRSQIGGALMMRTLHARIVEETTLRERLAREQLQGEMAVARRIQTALAPRMLSVPGVSIAARMQPADEVGGDYYDVIPTDQGCWFGIGDVTGHGLLSGLVMLMIQSMVSTLVSTRPNASPARLVQDLNTVLVPNIRQRLERDEHATFMLIKYLADGKITFAGAHEDLIVYRARQGSCEVVPSAGIWVGIRPDIGEATRDQSLELSIGDVLVLYTDGLTEAQNADFEQFGLERLADVVRANASKPVDGILGRIFAAVRGWTAVQRDDMTCVVLRYEG
jgi:DNA-binding LacI/PurR family transcriptional regulator/serine phosphatase RsbU (regulator of sigma subunit)